MNLMPSPCRLYLITPPQPGDPNAFADTLGTALAAGDVAAVQIRLKGDADPETGEPAAPDPAAAHAAAERWVPVIQSAGAAAIINDDPELAAAVGADGVHVGQDDAPYAQARALLGDQAIVGVTCHDSRHLAMEAGEAGADYVAFGAFYSSATKAPKTRATPDLVQWWSEVFTVPCVAIGGITADNCAPIVRAGADFLAVSAGVWAHPDGPAAGVQALNAAIADAHNWEPSPAS